MNIYALIHVPSGEQVGFVQLNEETVRKITSEAHRLTINMWQAGTTHEIESFVLQYSPSSLVGELGEDNIKGIIGIDQCENPEMY